MSTVLLEKIDVTKLDAKAKAALADRLYAIHASIFDGVSRKEFVRYVIYPDAKYTRIFLYKSAEGRVVGYHAVHDFGCFISGKKIIVYRAEAGLLPGYRGGNRVLITNWREAFKCVLRHPFKEIYVLSCYVHPVMYHQNASHLYEVYPNWRYETPRRLEEMLFALAEDFHLERPGDHNNPYVRVVGWVTKQSSDLDVNTAKKAKTGDLAYYLSRNPHYKKGYGLLTLIPLSVRRLLLAMVNIFLSRNGFRYQFHKH